jgi:hypothetical protein
VKQQLAAIRMLFDCLIAGQIVPTNPAGAVRGPKHVVNSAMQTMRPGRPLPRWGARRERTTSSTETRRLSACG